MAPHPTRRRIALAIPLLGLAGGAWGATASPLRRQSRALMGTRVDLIADVADEVQWLKASTAAWAEMARLEALMSLYAPGSVVSQINALAAQGTVRVPAEVMPVLLSAKRMSAVSEGAFDITVGAMKAWRFDGLHHTMPDAREIERERRLIGNADWLLNERAGTTSLRRAGMALDLGGIAKLPILQAGLDVLRRHGVHHALVNGGGDVLISGSAQGRPWKVGLRDPRAPERLVGTLALSGQAVVASSGDYERFFVVHGQKMHHILDPRTGRPTQRSPGVSLLARDVDQVNGMGAALMVMGLDRARSFLARQHGVDALVASADGTLWASDGMARHMAV